MTRIKYTDKKKMTLSLFRLYFSELSDWKLFDCNVAFVQTYLSAVDNAVTTDQFISHERDLFLFRR